MDRLPASLPQTEGSLLPSSTTSCQTSGPTDPPSQPRDEHTSVSPHAWHDLLVVSWVQYSAQLDIIDALPDRAGRLETHRLDIEFHGCQILLCQALREYRFFDRRLVWDRGATLFRAGLQRQIVPPSLDATPSSLSLSSKRAWLREMRALIDLVVRDSDPRLAFPRPDRPIAPPLAGTPPDNFVTAVRERAAHLTALRRGRPAQSPDQPGHPQLDMALKILQPLRPDDVLDPASLPRWQAALRETIALEDEALAIAGAIDARPSIAIRHLRHCRALQGKGPPEGGP